MITVGEAEFFRHDSTSVFATATGPGGRIVASLASRRAMSESSSDIEAENAVDDLNSGSGGGDSSDHRATESTRSQEIFTLTVWSTSCGMGRLGSIIFKDGISGGSWTTANAIQIVWHLSGDRICIILCGELVILDVVWKHRYSDDVGYATAALRCDEGENEESVASFVRCELRMKFKIQLDARSLCQGSNGTEILVGCSRGSEDFNN